MWEMWEEGGTSADREDGVKFTEMVRFSFSLEDYYGRERDVGGGGKIGRG